METYGGVEVWLHVFLTAELDGGKYSVSRLYRLIPTPEKELPVPFDSRFVSAPEPVWTL